jgi:predicted nucleic acid-binding protein
MGKLILAMKWLGAKEESAIRLTLLCHTLLLACATLPVTVVERSDYEGKLSTARRRIGKRDPDDVDVLALALQLNVAVWSNDKDFEDTGVEWHTTAHLLRMLGIESP